MTNCYVTSLPIQALRASAGFDPLSRSYFVPRSTVLPPPELVAMVWPQLDTWIAKFSEPAVSGVDENLAAGAWLELMQWLRVVLLQDAVFLRKLFPSHPIFKDPLFSTPYFEDFAATVIRIDVEAPVDGFVTIVEKSNKAMGTALREVIRGQQVVVSEIEQLRRDLKAHSKSADDKIDQYLNSTIEVEFSPGQGILRAGVASRQLQRPPQPASSSQPANHLSSPGAALPLPTSNATNQEGEAVAYAPQATDAPTVWEIPRVNSISDLLKLWRIGWAGMPSIDSLNANFGSAWRAKTAVQKVHYSTRKLIIDEVVKRAGLENLPEHVVAEKMDQERGTDSLDKVMKKIRAARKDG